MKTFIIANQKGGVGKTTTAAALAAGLTLRNYRVLMIDSDPQGNLSASAGIDPDSVLTLDDILSGNRAIEDVILKTESFGDIIPCSLSLADADRRLVDFRAHKILKNNLRRVAFNYDYCIIDAPPSLGILSLNGFFASDWIIVPVNAAAFSLQGINSLVRIVNEVREENTGLSILGVLITRFNPRTNMGKDAVEALSVMVDQIGTVLLDSRIRQGVAIEASQAEQRDLFSAYPKSGVAHDYDAFVEEILTRIKEDER